MSEGFRERLDAVNKELNGILNHNANVRDSLAEGRHADPTTFAYSSARAMQGLRRGDSSTTAAGEYASLLAEKAKGSEPGRGGAGDRSGGSYDSSSILEATFAEAAGASRGPRATTDGRRPQPFISTSHDVLRQEVREVVNAEMEVQHAALQAIVAREWELRVREIDATLRGRFGELRGANEALQRVVSELADEVAHVNQTLGSRIDKAEADFSRKLAAFKREYEEALRQARSETRDLSEMLVKAKVDSNSMEKRFADLGQMLQSNITDSLKLVEKKWSGFEDEIGNTLRLERKKQEAFADTVEKALQEYADQIQANRGKIAAIQTEVNVIGEEGVGMRSQLRTARSELNQLEMLVRSIGVRKQQQQEINKKSTMAGFEGIHLDPLSLSPATGGRATAAHAVPPTNRQRRDDAPWVSAGLPFSEGIRLQQDVYALKQSVAYLAEVVERKLMGGVGGERENQKIYNSSSASSSDDDNGERKHGKKNKQKRQTARRSSDSFDSPPPMRRRATDLNGSYSPTKYRVPESDEESNANLARSSID